MRFLVMGKATKETEAGIPPTVKQMEAMEKFTQELLDAGILISGEGLQPSSKGARVKFNGANRTVIDGPFSETKELIAGFSIWEVKSLEEAIEWVKRSPNCFGDEGEVEIRQLMQWQPEDLVADPANEKLAAK